MGDAALDRLVREGLSEKLIFKAGPGFRQVGFLMIWGQRKQHQQRPWGRKELSEFEEELENQCGTKMGDGKDKATTISCQALWVLEMNLNFTRMLVCFQLSRDMTKFWKSYSGTCTQVFCQDEGDNTGSCGGNILSCMLFRGGGVRALQG